MVNEKQRTSIFINILISCIASSMLATALTTALPSMVVDFHISVTTGQWLTSGYSLAMGITMPLTAFLITKFPTRKLYLTAISLFIAGLALCVVAPNFVVLMFGRVLQACGNGILTSMAQVILLTMYPLEKRGTIMGWYGLSIGAAPVIAPTIAGILVDTSGWRMIFIAAIVIMAISLIFAFIVFKDVLPTSKKHFDTLSFVISGIAYAGITLGIGNIGTYKLVSLPVLCPLILGILGMFIFAKRQFKRPEPFLDLHVLQNKVFVISLIGSMLLYFVMMGSSIILPLFIQTIKGFSATTSGLVTLPGSLAMTILSPFAGKIYDRFGMRRLFIAGALVLLISNVGMIFITLKTSLILIAALNVLRSLAIGCLMMPLVTWGMSGIDVHMTAHGTALLTSLRTIAGAVGSAIFVSIMSTVAKNSAATLGAQAPMHGVNMTFLFMSLVSVILMLVAIFAKTNQRSAE